MGFAATAVLGLIAGATILLGLPVARLRGVSADIRSLLTATSCGVLLFLLWDVLSAAVEPIHSALAGIRAHVPGATGSALLNSFVLFAGIAIGLFALVGYGSRMHQPKPASVRPGPGAMAATELTRPVSDPARSLAFAIAVGIGLHNFAEGLAIGGSSATGQTRLAWALVIGFALHNATEGFGVAGPLAGGENRPSWKLLFGLGLIAGGPTAVGTIVGYSWTSTVLSIAFLGVAAGSILFVIVQLLSMVTRAGRREFVSAGLFVGLLAGFATDFVLTAIGA